MIKHKLIKQFIPVALLSVSMIFVGCEKKTQTTEQPKDEVKTEVVPTDTSSKVIESPLEEKISIPDIKGTWTGTFDKRATTLTITEQTDSSFAGKISIKYKQTLNQDVKGTFSPTTKQVSMIDQIHSKYMGKYSGKLSDDDKNLSGTFTMNRDGTNTSFNLNKK
jgi:hypothetical protein